MARAIRAAIEAAHRRLPLPEAQARLAELLAVPPHRRRDRVQDDSRFHDVAVVQALAHHVLHLAESPGPQVAELAQLALSLIERLPPESCPAGLAADLAATFWSSLAHLETCRGRTEEAERALAAAGVLAQRGTGDPVVLAGVEHERGLYWLRCGDTPAARVHLRAAASLFQQVGEDLLHARSVASLQETGAGHEDLESADASPRVDRGG